MPKFQRIRASNFYLPYF